MGMSIAWENTYSYTIPQFVFFLSVVFPVFVFTHRNKFNNPRVTGVRFLFAILSGWFLLYCYLLVVQIGLEPQSINGAANAFVSVLGWVMPCVLVTVVWLLKKFPAATVRTVG